VIFEMQGGLGLKRRSCEGEGTGNRTSRNSRENRQKRRHFSLGTCQKRTTEMEEE